MNGHNPETTEFYLILHRPGEALDVTQQVHPRQQDGIQSFNLAHLATIARQMRTDAGEHDGTITLDMRKVSAQPDFSDGSRIQAFADGRIEVDLDESHIRVDGRPMHFTMRQFALVSLLSSRVDYIWSRQTLKQQIWGTQHVTTRHLTGLVSGIRNRLGHELRGAIATREQVGYFARRTLN